MGWADLGRAFLVELASDPAAVHVTVLASGSQRRMSLAPPGVPHVTVEDIAGVTTDPDVLQSALAHARPDVIVVLAAPFPGGDLRTADAQAVLTMLQIRRLTQDTRVPLVGQLFAPLAGFGVRSMA